MCDASKELQEVLKLVLEERKVSHQQEVRVRTFSVKDLTLPLVLMIPIFVGGLSVAWALSSQLTAYTSAVEAAITELKKDVGTMKSQIQFAAYDRFTRDNYYTICLSQQAKNPEVNFNCDFVRQVKPLIPLKGATYLNPVRKTR